VKEIFLKQTNKQKSIKLYRSIFDKFFHLELWLFQEQIYTPVSKKNGAEFFLKIYLLNKILYLSRWFHKPCTKLMKFTEKFSCRSVKMKCLETPPAPVKIKPVLPVVKMAVVKFVPDIPRFFIKNIWHSPKKRRKNYRF